MSDPIKDAAADAAVEALVVRAMAGGPLTKNEINVLLRATLTPAPGYLLACCDYSQVEARALAWAAGDAAAVAVFTSGADPYAALARRLFGLLEGEWDKKKHAQPRDTSKKAELGCGYGMGAPKFTVTAEKGGMVWHAARECIQASPDWSGTIPCSDPLCGAVEHDRKGNPFTHGARIIVETWRELHAPIVRFWYALSDAFMGAVKGRRTRVGPYEFGPVGKDVWCMLPSGRPLVYHRPQIRKDSEGRPRACYLGPEGWSDLYGGKIAENVTQALCRDLLAHALVGAERMGLRPVLHVHDELVCEVPADAAYECLAVLEGVMTDLPGWAATFPVDAEGHVCKRYRKG